MQGTAFSLLADHPGGPTADPGKASDWDFGTQCKYPRRHCSSACDHTRKSLVTPEYHLIGTKHEKLQGCKRRLHDESVSRIKEEVSFHSVCRVLRPPGRVDPYRAWHYFTPHHRKITALSFQEHHSLFVPKGLAQCQDSCRYWWHSLIIHGLKATVANTTCATQFSHELAEPDSQYVNLENIFTLKCQVIFSFKTMDDIYLEFRLFFRSLGICLKHISCSFQPQNHMQAL